MKRTQYNTPTIFLKWMIAVMLLTTALFSEEIYATFTVEPLKRAELAFSAGGIVDKVNVDVGSKVKVGEIVASLKNDDLKALLDVAQTNFKYAKKAYDRQLKVKHLIDQAQLDNFAFKYEQSKAQLAYQRAQLDKTYLKAPFDGEIFYKIVEAGDVVSGMAPKTILKIQTDHKRKLLVKFDQKYWSIVKVGDSFHYNIDGSKQNFVGKIIKIYPNIDTKTNQAVAEVEAEDLKPGLFGTGYIKTRD